MKFLIQGRAKRRQELNELHGEINHLQHCLREIGRATNLRVVRDMVRVALGNHSD